MRIAAGSFGFLVCAAVTRPAYAESLPIAVTRAPETEACPDERDLSERIERIRGRNSHGPARYRVTFARGETSLSATIRSENGANARVLKAEDPTCQALARATAVALALLLDAETPAAAPADRPPPNTPPPTPQPAQSRREQRARGSAAVSASALFAVVRPVAPVLGIDLGLQIAAFRASVGAVWMPPQELVLGTGSVRETLAAATARFCLAPFRNDSLRFDFCAGAWLGVRGAAGSGYTENGESHSTWLGVPLELALVAIRSPLGAELSGGAILSFPNRHYTVTGFGPAYESPPVGALITLRGLAAWPF